jgi:hypothetical protein
LHELLLLPPLSQVYTLLLLLLLLPLLPLLPRLMLC